MTNTYKPIKGFTLIELLITLTIISVSLGFVFDASRLLDKYQVERQARSIIQAVMYARSSAIKHGESVFICPSNNGADCDKSWSNTMLVYRNNDQSKTYEPTDEVLYQFDLARSKNRIRWGSFGKQHYLEFLPSGMTNFQNGTFTVCAESKDIRSAIPVIINIAGRPYFGRDKNSDGVREYSSGKPVSCG